jgi:hypothetical protein
MAASTGGVAVVEPSGSWAGAGGRAWADDGLPAESRPRACGIAGMRTVGCSPRETSPAPGSSAPIAVTIPGIADTNQLDSKPLNRRNHTVGLELEIKDIGNEWRDANPSGMGHGP